MKKRLVVGALAAGVMFVAGQATAFANVTWCVSDPPIEVVSPGGNYLTVNNLVYLSPRYVRFSRQITDDATAAPDGQGGTLVTVHVRIPARIAQAQVVSSDYRYQVISEGAAQGGMVITLYLDMPIS